MKNHFIILYLLISILCAANDDIPYDWSGQYGVITEAGRLMWNQDWTMGVLLFDGTFTNYPKRLGPAYLNNYKILNKGGIVNNQLVSSDSLQIKSSVDYFRGDFSYDQLGFDFFYLDKNRNLSLSGFKRTYNGPYGQYTDLNGSKNPLQQSYSLDYSSKNNDESFDLSVGYFITKSRLNLGDPADFKHNEKILTTGIAYTKVFNDWQYNTYSAFFQQYYSMDFDSTKAYLNRFHIDQFISRENRNSAILSIGVELDNQRLSMIDTTKVNRIWSTIYGAWRKSHFDIKIGATLGKQELAPYVYLSTQTNVKKAAELSAELKYEAIPKHPFLQRPNEGKIFEQWFTARSAVQLNWKPIPVNIAVDYSYIINGEIMHKYYINNELYDISNSLLSGTIFTNIPIIRDWTVDLSVRHTFIHNLYSDGIGELLAVGFSLHEELFNNNMLAKLRFWGDAFLNHHQNLGYEGFHFGPYVTDNTDLALENYWVFNLELSAKISKMTLMWKVNNILQTVESLTEQFLPNLNDNYLLITNSNNFPPMNRFVTLHIIWNFEN